MATRVLVVGQGLFGEGLHHLLAGAANLNLVGTAPTWEAAQALMQDQPADVVIVDQRSVHLDQTDLLPFLQRHGKTLKVICLTLAENTMTILAQKEVANATAEDLLQILQSLGGAEGGSGA